MVFGPLEIIFIVFIISSVIIFIIFVIIHYLYPSVRPEVVQSGQTQDGPDGPPGNDGILTLDFASDGLPGPDGRQGKRGKDGAHGPAGVVGDNGAIGPTGLIGKIGAEGSPGSPSNSKPSIIAKTDGEVSDSYIMEDFFSYNNVFYELIVYANIENHSRFVLDQGREISNNSLLTTTPVPGNSISDVYVGQYYSDLRIALCSSDGITDTILYVSPPISRKSFLFKYSHQETPNDDYSQMERISPIRNINESNSVYFFEDIPNSSNIETKYYHVVKGLAKYKIVANLTPAPSFSNHIKYRIIETYKLDQEKPLILPKISFPSNSGIINIISPRSSGLSAGDLDPERYILNISEDFNLNKVIEKSFIYGSKIWNETSETVLNIASSNTSEIVPFENTYNILTEEYYKTIDFFTPDAYWKDRSSINTNYISTGNYIELKSQAVNNTTISDVILEIGSRKYTSNFNVSNFYPLNKFFIQITFDVVNPGLTDGDKITVTYGSEYSIDLINFSNLFGKSLFFAQTYNIVSGATTSYIMSNESVGTYLKMNPLYPIKVGYSTPDDTYLYTTNVMLQRITPISPAYYINIPLHDYKRG